GMIHRMRRRVRRFIVGLLAVAALTATADPAVAATQTGPGRGPPPPGDAPALEAALVGLRSLEAGGGWGTWDGPGMLRPGDVDPSVTALRLRLERSGDLLQGDAAPGPMVPDPGGGGAVSSLEGAPASPLEYDSRLEEA